MTMQPYSRTITYDVPPSLVYEAFTQADKLREWWTNKCEAGSKAGDKNIFYFDEAKAVFTIEKLDPGKEVVWKCVEHDFKYEEPITKTDEWVGTTIRIQLKKNGKLGTDMTFTHEGLVPELQCYSVCEQGWDHFLKTSLKKFLEFGKGQPYICKQ